MATARSGWWRGLQRWLWRLLCLWLLVSLFSVLLLRFVNPPYWSWRLARAIEPPGKITQVQQQWQPLSAISRHLQLAVIASEDQRFPEHFGFDFKQIGDAIADARKGDGLRGASTISQQTAKNLFMWPSRSFVRKGLEAWFTLLIELCWDKQRILEVYLNVVEFGPGIYGADAAAHHYFHKPASRLSRYEAALLAAILPNPWHYRIAPPSAYMAERADWISTQMRQLGQITLQKLD
ncbi:monofunctional biosynthetic peptidoglycan transglycosylase [Shewanella dokdonensis]|uniref:Biosynthetic peptidoglycan transglycosylase n=1 Tax=Shewanella dokdonensis TaxID=712036 RepID=A0ABX8DHW4_9GAMM|nr:monofunctional biosynthetic peptidoglycan transglycosylase [Shewanella dokdonensis]MCL1074418.1 monofunctional biosynthetic peptidoglycan transglycosylase [Shewanella dokdonensis]QVK24084.1 monofunctional biosynthetic peptidoglycan transglycosylase [Shewanella dokdonensis]